MNESLVVLQAIGFVGVMFGVASYQPKHRKHILYFQLVSNLFWVLHFSLIGATTGAALNTAGGLRAILFNAYGQKKRRPRWLLGLVIFVVISAGFLSWRGWLSLLPMMGMVIATISFWQLNEQRIRFFLLFASPFWLIYNLLSGSYAGIASEILVMISITIALWRYRRQSLCRPAVQKSI